MKILNKIGLLASLALLGGCHAATSLSCTTAPGGSYVNVTNINQQDPILLKSYADLCGFSKEQTNAT